MRTHQGSEGNQERALQTKAQRSGRTQALGQGEGEHRRHVPPPGKQGGLGYGVCDVNTHVQTEGLTESWDSTMTEEQLEKERV